MAGLLNFIAVADAYHIAIGKKSMTMQLSHFSSALLFAVFASVVFGITQRNTPREMIRYGLYCFAMFAGGVIVAGWTMWLIRR